MTARSKGLMTARRTAIGYDLIETDEDGIERPVLSVSAGCDAETLDGGARLLLAAHNLSGGWHAAKIFLKVEAAQKRRIWDEIMSEKAAAKAKQGPAQ